jgi:hypothetical protein
MEPGASPSTLSGDGRATLGIDGSLGSSLLRRRYNIRKPDISSRPFMTVSWRRKGSAPREPPQYPPARNHHSLKARKSPQDRTCKLPNAVKRRCALAQCNCREPLCATRSSVVACELSAMGGDRRRRTHYVPDMQSSSLHLVCLAAGATPSVRQQSTCLVWNSSLSIRNTANQSCSRRTSVSRNCNRPRATQPRSASRMDSTF